MREDAWHCSPRTAREQLHSRSPLLALFRPNNWTESPLQQVYHDSATCTISSEQLD